MSGSAPSRAAPPALASPPGLVRPLLRVATIAAGFVLVVVIAMLARHVLTRPEAPLKSAALTSLKEQLVAHPKDEALKQQIRALDLQTRTAHFERLTFNRTGAWLVLVGMAVLVLAGRQAAAWLARAPAPQARREDEAGVGQRAAWARRAVTGAALIVAATLAGLVVANRTVLPKHPVQMQKLLAKLAGEDTDEGAALPPPTEFAANWPRFLGPTGNACSTNAALPVTVKVPSGEGIRWKVTVPAPGFSSPIVWSNRVFLTGGNTNKREVFCFDTANGAPVWQAIVQNVPGSPARQPDIPEGTGYAASTMATDGRRVFAIFGNGDIASFQFDGRLAWAKNLGVPDNPYGHAQSLLTWQGRLIVPLDQSEAEKGRSRLFLLEGANGKVVWEKTRPVPSSWATPIAFEAAGKPQIVTLGGAWVISYSARDASELWRVECLNGEITPSPIFVGGYVVAVSPSEKVVAVRPDGQGDVTQTHVAWAYEENVPDIASPVSNGELVFTASSQGVVTCLALKDGKKQWDHDLEFEINASPVIAGDRLCVVGKKGVAVVLQAASPYREFGRFEFGEQVLASPALAGSRMFVRTANSLFCVGANAGARVQPQ
jgi:outer membrane protein assembly factor BamB